MNRIQTKQLPTGPQLLDVSLLARSRKLQHVTTGRWYAYAWLDDNRIIVGEEPNRDFHLTIYSRTGGVISRLKELNKLVDDLSGDNSVGWDLSPDKKSLIATYRGYGSMIRLDGKRRQAIDADGFWSRNRWLSDNRHYIHAWRNRDTAHEYLTVNDILGKKPPIKIDISSRDSLYTEDAFDVRSANGKIYGVADAPARNKKDKRHHLYVVCRSPYLVWDRITKSIINLENEGKVIAAVLSPDCRRVAVIQETLGLPQSTQKVSGAGAVYCMWVSTINGNKAEEIGCLLPPAKYDAEELESGLRWLPDGKMLSFVYRKDLYVVPANGPDFGRFVSPPSNSRH